VARKGRHSRGVHSKNGRRTVATPANSVALGVADPTPTHDVFLAVVPDVVAANPAFVAAPDEPAPTTITATPDAPANRASITVPGVSGTEPLFAPVPETSYVNPMFTAAPDGLIADDAPPDVSDRPSSSVATEPAPPESVSPTLILTSGGRTRVRRRARWVLSAIGVVVVVVAAGAAIQLTRPIPRPVVRSIFVAPSRVPGVAPSLPWPAKGEAAVSVPALGIDVESAPEPSVPIASLTKLMTAYLILTDHPLSPDAQGPMVALTAADQAEAAADQAAGATAVPVVPGELLSERQLLDGLLVHSANNFADALARWDAGAVPAFVQKMNQTAAALGMRATHYADTNGLSAATVGSADDELRVAQADMDIPTFAAVVDQRSVRLPIAGVLSNYVSSVGLAAEHDVAGRLVLVLAAVTGQPGADPLAAANVADVRLIGAVGSGLTLVPLLERGAPVATVTAPWPSGRVVATTSSALTLVGWPGQRLDVRMTSDPPPPGAPSGTRVGTLSAAVGPEREVAGVAIDGRISVPTWRWRVLRG
jgi:serine-type D-Ala-D-Ala carboxypeptidase (penicillin-binding protein 5/6)